MRQYIVDAFTDQVFSGNPAAVCVMKAWISDDLMCSIAMENNLSETAFIVKEEEQYHLRWFTPGGEIDLCGHATLASAYVILNFYETTADHVVFTTKSGLLTVHKDQEKYEMDLPAYQLTQIPVNEKMAQAIGVRPLEAWLGRDLVCVLESEQQVIEAKPDLELVEELDGLLLHITAKGTEYDCVSRSFAPKVKVPEDPVCGSGHCHVIPLWKEKLEKNQFTARQASRRGGTLYCHDLGERILIAGKAAVYSISELFPNGRE